MVDFNASSERGGGLAAPRVHQQPHSYRYEDGAPVSTISDAEMQSTLALSRGYSAVLLTGTAKLTEPGSEVIIREHGRRNLETRADGKLLIVCPVIDESPLCGICILDLSVDDATQWIEKDPAVRAGIFTFTVNPIRSFPGDSL